jgi:Cu-processing system ATP-binding protein
MIEVRGLSKAFGKRTVLDQVDVSFPQGTVTALLGPNGAGKTTLLKCVLGLARPTRGSVWLSGAPVDDGGAYRHALGYMPQLPNFPPHLTGRELLAMVDDLRDFDGEPDEDLVDAFDLRRDLDKPFRTLSGGTRQKVNAALAFRYATPVLILDEPTAGLDPVAALALKEKVRVARDEGRTVLVTSHNLGDLESVADAVVFLHEGRVRFDGPLDDLLLATGQPRLEAAIADLMRGVDRHRRPSATSDGEAASRRSPRGGRGGRLEVMP